MNIAYNMDCLDAMRKMPDNAFDLAVVDPPYGDGLHADDGGGKGWFTKYNQACSQNVHVEREREGEPTEVQPIWRQIRPLQVRIGGGGADTTHSDSAKTARITRTGGTWATKYAKKS